MGTVQQEVIRMPMELIDLEISLAKAAADNYRFMDKLRDVFEPFPPFLLEKRNAPRLLERFLIRPRETKNETKNMDVMRSIIKSFPAVSKMRLCADELDLKAQLVESWLSTPEGMSLRKSSDKYSGTEVWQLPYNVLQFILSTNKLS